MNNHQYPCNQIHDAGFPEGQLLANGATDEQCAEISAAFNLGQTLPHTGNEVIDRISGYLTEVSTYGKYRQAE